MHRALLCALALLALSCPVIQAQQEQRRFFIFGYGSLLNTASTEKSNCGLAGFAEGVLDGLRILLQQAATNTNSTADRLLTTLDGCQVQASAALGAKQDLWRAAAPHWHVADTVAFPLIRVAQGQRVVRIRGLRRGWYFPCELGSISFLHVTHNETDLQIQRQRVPCTRADLHLAM